MGGSDNELSNTRIMTNDPNRSSHPRPSWDEYFLQIAHIVASRSSCPRLSVGSVIVKDHRIIATGYNGAPSNMPQCNDVGCDMHDGHCLRSVHSEINAIAQAAEFNHNLQDLDIYVTHEPCTSCANALRSAGIRNAYFRHHYPSAPNEPNNDIHKVEINAPLPLPAWGGPTK